MSSKQALLSAVQRFIEPELGARGFEGKRGHWVRRDGPLVQVVELQHSIYGGRVTANLGLDLVWLLPTVRWVPRPGLGPHAHDCVRWVRVGIASPERQDRWWAYGDEPETIEEAARGLGYTIVESGLRWLGTKGDRTSFLDHALERLERSRSPRSPDGAFNDIRLAAIVLAWNGDMAGAKAQLQRARTAWEEEKARLVAARAHYVERQHARSKDVEVVPDLLSELDALISTTTDASLPWVASAARRPRSRSGTRGSSRAGST